MKFKGFLMKSIVNECFIFKSKLMATLVISKRSIIIIELRTPKNERATMGVGRGGGGGIKSQTFF